MTVQFLRRKVHEYEALKREIAELKREVESTAASTNVPKGWKPR